MKAIILAAGIGKRCKPYINDKPKCLIKVGKKTLLERHLEILKQLKFDEVVIVVGYLKELIKATYPDNFKGMPIKYIENPHYTEGNVVSLFLAREEFNCNSVIMDADVVYHPNLMKKLIKSRNANCFLLDPNFHDTGEEMKLLANNGHVVGISRKVDVACEKIGEGVGFLKIDHGFGQLLKTRLERYISEGKRKSEYEEVLNELLRTSEVNIGYELVSNIPWTEIDFYEDILKAEKEVLPKIDLN